MKDGRLSYLRFSGGGSHIMERTGDGWRVAFWGIVSLLVERPVYLIRI